MIFSDEEADNGSNSIGSAYNGLITEIDKLGKIADSKAIEKLSQILRGDFPETLIDYFDRTEADDLRIRKRVAEILAGNGSDPCVEVLYKGVSGIDSQLRKISARALVDACVPGALKYCLKAISMDLEIDHSDIPPYITGMCISDPNTFDQLIELLSNDGYSRYTVFILASFLTDHHLCDDSTGRVDTQKLFEDWVKRLTADDLEVLKQKYNSGRRFAKIGIAYVLAYRGQEAVLDTLITTLFDETIGDMNVIREAAASVLERLPVTRARDALAETFTRFKLVDLAGKTGLTDPEHQHLDICLKAAVALARQQDQRAYDPLVLLFDTFHFIDAGEALGPLGDPRAIPILKRGIDEIRMPPLSGNIARGCLGDATVLPTLIEYFDSGFKEEGLIEAIGTIGDIRAVETFQAKLDQEKTTPEERERLRQALENIGTPGLELHIQAGERLVQGLVHDGTMKVKNTGGDARDISINAIGENIRLVIKNSALPPVLERGKTVNVPIRLRFPRGGPHSIDIDVQFTDLLKRRRSVTLQQHFTVHSPNVFISYVRENEDEVTGLTAALKTRIDFIGIWHDKSSLMPGTPWKAEIQKAIKDIDFFIACFSREYESREETFMNEEIAFALREINQRKPGHNWFIPLKFSECCVPAITTGNDGTIEDMHIVELYKDWDKGIEKLVEAIQNERPVPDF